jgi:hypothetical protein
MCAAIGSLDNLRLARSLLIRRELDARVMAAMVDVRLRDRLAELDQQRAVLVRRVAVLGTHELAFRARAARVYAADLVGAGLGSVVLLGLLCWLWPEQILKAIAAAGLVATGLGAWRAAHTTTHLDRHVVALGLAAIVGMPTTQLRFESPARPSITALRTECGQLGRTSRRATSPDWVGRGRPRPGDHALVTPQI